MHPKEFEISKDVLDFLIKKETNLSKIRTKAKIEKSGNEDLSKSTKWKECDNKDFKTVWRLKIHWFIHMKKANKVIEKRIYVWEEWETKEFES